MNKLSIESDEPPFNRLHDRLLQGDTRMVDELCGLLAPVLRRYVSLQVLKSDKDDVETAVDDALLVYFAHPGLFDRARGSLPAWLGRIAANRARDLRRKSRRRSGHEVAAGLDFTALGRWL